jgi:hypothetical protein
VNSEIELHDSTLGALTLSDGDAVLSLRPAYVHKSTGRPGIDVGTGWMQDVDLTIADATVTGSAETLPTTISDGTLLLGTECHENQISFTPAVADVVQLTLTLVDGGILTVRGCHLTVEGVGEPQYVEAFPGNGHG